MNPSERETQPQEDYKLIELTLGQFSKVSPEDFDWLSQWKWHAQKSVRRGVEIFSACRAIPDISKKGRQTQQIMHRLILGAPSDMQVDHINGDRLDNRRGNLRLATPSQNSMNRRVRSDSTTGLRGVEKHYARNGWVAHIGKERKKFYLGYFDTKEDAYEAYKKAAIELHGDFARFD